MFGEIEEALFRERPNRFTVDCTLGKRPVRAYLPNPGRLWELLLPGSRLYLVRSGSAGRKTPYTVVAVEKDGAPVMLHTHLANRVVQRLIEAGKVPGLEGARIVRPEVTIGNSRFDFLLKRNGGDMVIEVKSCTLFGEEIAMFPDAVTLRGRRHLEELAGLSRRGTAAGVIFLVHSPRPRFFMPEYHTDLDFARTLCSLREDLFIRALSVSWSDKLVPSPGVRQLEIPWGLVEGEARDRGSYMVILRVESDLGLSLGGLGGVLFREGFYIYVGSAMKGLDSRIGRHRRRRKRPRWHIDYLRGQADFHAALPLRASAPLECDVAGALERISGWSVRGFGVSDCRCRSHLFGMKDDPLRSAAFMRVLQHFRMDRLQGMLQD